MLNFKFIKSALIIALWFVFLGLPILGIRFDVKKNIIFYGDRLAILAIVVFVIALIREYYLARDTHKQSDLLIKYNQTKDSIFSIVQDKKVQRTAFSLLFIGFTLLPIVSSLYQVTIFSLALIYVILALGLNIVVGIAGQLVLGYAAFYAVGAYTYALLNMYFGVSFWFALPLAGLFSTLAGLLLGFPVLRLRGDYLAIVTLGFGEITRLLLTNLSDLTNGSRGVSNIPRPSFFGMDFNLEQSTIYIYYIAFVATLITIIVVTRLKHSRIGLALQALKEDEIACEAMGIDLRKTKLMAFALGSCWAGFAGVILAARNTYINPASFNFMDSAMILSMVVLGGMGSIWGVVLAALVLSLLPEYLRAFSEYRMLIFGAMMVLMMIFRPQGIVPAAKRKYSLTQAKTTENEE